VSLRRVPRGAAIEVADEGAGIDSEFLPHLFERFRQAETGSSRRHGGLGLGLSIVKNLVELHGGQVQATSAGLGQGTRITATFPVYERLPPAVNISDEHNMGTELRGVRVLVVDDDSATCELIARILRA
jgi:signal transduction histidine kinase